MKMALATYIHLFKSLGESLKDYDIGILLTSDEEIGGMNGVQYCLDELKISGGIALIPDGGFNWNVETAAKGILQFKMSSKQSIPNFLNCIQQISHYFELKREFQEKSYFTTCNGL
jgi:acetylornithine deacetylase/succinyl-diaminopimelate desuccinylase-like protein